MQSLEKENLVRKQIMLSSKNIEKLSAIAKDNRTSFAHAVRSVVDSYEPGSDNISEDEKEFISDLIALCKETTIKAGKALDRSHEKVNQIFEKLDRVEGGHESA